MLDQAAKKQIVDKVHECIATVEKKYKVTFKKPLITFNVRGTCGGRAHYGMWKVDFNPILAKDNLQTYLDDVVPHEVAHLATWLVYPNALKRGFGQKRRPHGAEWASIMVALGADPKRTHSMDTTEARVRTKVTYSYKCSGCGHEFQLGPKRHAKFQRGVTFWHPECGKEKGKLVPVAASTPAPVIKPVVAVPTLSKPRVPTGETKLAQCYRLFENYPGYSRAEMINVFVQEVDMTPAGAATYYAKCKSMRG